MIEAVLFDLDDTLFLQREWLAGAWRAVATAAAAQGADPRRLDAALQAVAAEGSDRGRIIDRALERAGATGVDVAPLVEAFLAHRAGRLDPLPGAVQAVARLRRRVPVGLVTDGNPRVQRDKLAALGLTDAFDAVVISDELGRQWRKPHPRPFLAAVEQLGVKPAGAVFVGDRPDKDVAGSRRAGLRPVRVRTGEYAGVPDRPRPWRSVADAVAAVDLLLPLAG